MSIEADKGMCRHQEFYAFVDAEVERWITKHESAGYMCRDRSLVRANIIRGLRIGTYTLPVTVRGPLVSG